MSASLRIKRERLFALQKGICAYCGKAMPTEDVSKFKNPTLDHVIPRSKGGTDAYKNLVVAHARCNWRRGNGEPWRAVHRMQKRLKPIISVMLTWR